MGGDPPGHLLVGIDRRLDGALLAATHGGHDERRMRHGVRSDDSHGYPLSCMACTRPHVAGSG